MGDYDVNYHPSDIDNSTPLHFTRPFWSCMEAAASAVAENRSVVIVVGSGAFHCLYCPPQSHRAGALESFLSMEYVWPKHPKVVVGIATK